MRPTTSLDGPEARIYVMGIEDYVDQPSGPSRPRRWTSTSRRARRWRSGQRRGPRDQPGEHDGADASWFTTLAFPATPPDRIRSGGLRVRASHLLSVTQPLDGDIQVIRTPRLVRVPPRAHSLQCDGLRSCVCSSPTSTGQGYRAPAQHRRAQGEPPPLSRVAAPLTAGQPIRLEVEIWPIANVFKAGHRIRRWRVGERLPVLRVQPAALDEPDPLRFAVPLTPPRSQYDVATRADQRSCCPRRFELRSATLIGIDPVKLSLASLGRVPPRHRPGLATPRARCFPTR